jgi:hypothetical protein
MSEVIEPGLTELRETVATLSGRVEQISKSVNSGNRLTIWQFIGFTGVMAGTLFGAVRLSVEPLRHEMEARSKALEQRIELSERHILARFDDLKAVVLSQKGKQ